VNTSQFVHVVPSESQEVNNVAMTLVGRFITIFDVCMQNTY